MRDAGQGIRGALGEIGIGGVEELEVGGGHGENPSFPLGLCNFVRLFSLRLLGLVGEGRGPDKASILPPLISLVIFGLLIRSLLHFFLKKIRYLHT
jgi:hypothetical protein